MNRYIILSVITFFIATFDVLAAIAGYWSVADSRTRNYILLVEAGVLCLLVFNSVLIMQSVKANQARLKVAKFTLTALLLCICGDVINFNLTEQFYTHGEVIKHDYLIDSIWFFAPGYALLLIAIWPILYRAFSLKQLVVCLLITMLVALICYVNMAIWEAGYYIVTMAFIYSFIIAIPACFGILLSFDAGISRSAVAVHLISFGLILATIADAIIGMFWLYGNKGVGYFPLARELNWFVYIMSQCIVIHLPRSLNIQSATLKCDASSTLEATSPASKLVGE
ncbi:hypothetical protein PA25_16770 [Pseudoalteromonas sp. A25]|uniref:hypothetical protein n=1 Tax=Pseudoalteromonas sp. A25 TaxID=116092 RepID=UPI00126067AC|nr:hypothetical protein [Pseudoalteromonas sp. A25]BBN81692.1 hypothetical protein PA25_16770 [Pseudoalteromonas sp. A25]